MGAVVRAITVADQRAARWLVDLGREIRDARVTRGLSQAAVAHAVGISQGLLSLIERGLDAAVPLAVLARLCAAVGLELSVRSFPGGQPIRDKGHIALLERFRRAAGALWTWSIEVPLPIRGDKRAWDRVMRRPGFVIGVEGETRPTDLQELGRRLALKKRDGGVDRLILVLADTALCRQILRMNDLADAFPIPGTAAMRALAAGRDPGGDAIILI